MAHSHGGNSWTSEDGVAKTKAVLNDCRACQKVQLPHMMTSGVALKPEEVE
jgi:hypothetical protein